jgi:hypothetical protein
MKELNSIIITPENYDTLNQRTYKGVKCWKNKDYNRAEQVRDAIIAEPIWQTVFAKENDFYGIESMTVSDYKTKTIEKKIGGEEYETNIAIESFETGNNDVNLLSRIRMTDKKTKTLVPLADDAAWAFLDAFDTVAFASEYAANGGAGYALLYAGDRLGALLVLESVLCSTRPAEAPKED